MAGFVVYDLIFLAIFIVGVVVFLTSRKKNLERQGILYLYKTKLGIKFIDAFAKRFRNVLKPVQYIVLASGYILTVSILWIFVKTTYMYVKYPIAQYIKAPPIAPLIPYFPQLFGLESFFPPLYFTYFLIALAIVAVCHEFAHGIYARFYNFKIHSTGFAFLGPILGAFVEPDEKQMQRAPKLPQLVILAAGTFANILVAAIFGGVLILFFTSFFVPAGLKFDSYAVSQLNTSEINIVGNSSIGEGFLEIEAGRQNPLATYYVKARDLDYSVQNNLSIVYAYDDSPAFKQQLMGAITQIDRTQIKSYGDLVNFLDKKQPGDGITIHTAVLEPGRGTVQERRTYELRLAERNREPFLGIGFASNEPQGILGRLVSVYYHVKNPSLYYESTLGDFGWFIYYLLWWIVVIDFFVALFNMLPLGILDGGRYFYLTIWGLTGKEQVGKKAYKVVGYLIGLMLVIMMVQWFLGII